MEVTGAYFNATRVASGDMDTAQWRFVQPSGNLDVFLPTTGTVCLGVLYNKPKNNEHASVITIGHSPIRVANSLGAQAAIMAGNSGFAVLATSGQWVMGYTLTSATSGALAELLLTPHRSYATP